MRKLNIGCGEQSMEGFVGIDIHDYGQEIVRDITRGLPFDDNSVDEIYSSHCLEHIRREDVLFVWEEIYRVLKKGGTFTLTVPHSDTREAFMMGHLSYWNEDVVEVLCNKWGSPDHRTKTNWDIIQNKSTPMGKLPSGGERKFLNVVLCKVLKFI